MCRAAKVINAAMERLDGVDILVNNVGSSVALSGREFPTESGSNVRSAKRRESVLLRSNLPGLSSGAQKSAIDALDEVGGAVAGIETLVRVNVAGGVSVGR